MKLTRGIRRAAAVACVAASSLLVGGLAHAQPVRVIEDDIPLAAPWIADIDGDGKQDLLVGQFQDDPYTGARARFFRNIGTAASPTFSAGEFLQAGAVDASCDEFCITGFGPQLVDFNGDGLRDLITGSRACELFVFPGRNSGAFAAATRTTYVTDKNAYLRFRYNSRIFAHDWDGDGDLDLLTARLGATWLIRNEGDAQTPRFATPVELLAKSADAPAPTVTVVADWNDDGRDDLLLGRRDGSVVWLENTAQRGTEPRLAAPRALLAPGLSGPFKMDADGRYDRPPAPTRNIRLCVADYNDDGQPDLLLGDGWILQHAETNQSGDIKARRVKAYAIFAALRKQLEDLQAIPQDETAAARADREEAIAAKTAQCARAWRAAYVENQSFSRHGSVWLVDGRSLTLP